MEPRLLKPQAPDAIGATKTLMGIPARADAMSVVFQKTNQANKKFPWWREFQILTFIKYTKLYANDLIETYRAGRIDSVAQAMRNLLELCIWTEFCGMSEANAKRFYDDAARDMRDMLEAVQSVYTSVNKEPEARLAGMIDGLKTDAPKFDIDDIEAEYMSVNNAAGVVGKQHPHAKFYKAASKFAHPTALLLCMNDPPPALLDSLYETGAKATGTCLRNVETTVKTEYPDFSL
jgi:hypothetical protein